MLYKCVMKVNIDEAVYDISEEIYRQLHRDSNNNKNTEHLYINSNSINMNDINTNI